MRYESVYKRSQMILVDPITTKIINTFLELSDSVQADTFKTAMRLAKLDNPEKEGDESAYVVVTTRAAIKLFKCLSDHCHALCVEKIGKGNCDVEIQEANAMIADFFKYFIIAKTTWEQYIYYVLSIMAVASHKPDPYIQKAFAQLAKDEKYEKAFYQMCKDVVAKSKKIPYTKVFDLFCVADEYLLVSDLVRDDRRIHADRMATALLMEEENRQKKEQTKKAKKKKKKEPTPKKVPRIDDDDTVYEEEECVVCMEADCDVMFGCGHQICCAACAKKLANKCPYCNN